MPASRIGDLPVSRVKAVSTTGEPSPRSTSLGAYADQSAAVGTSAPTVNSWSRPLVVAAGTTVTPRPRRARPVMLAERSPGPRSTIQRVRGPTASVSWRGQCRLSTQMAWARCPARFASRPQVSAQARTRSTAGASEGWWKPSATGIDSTVGAKARPPRDFFSISSASVAVRFSMAVRRRRRASGVPLTTRRRGPLTAATEARSSSAPAEASISSWISAVVAPVTAIIGAAVPWATRPTRRPTMVAAAPIRREIAIRSTSLADSPSRRPAKAATPMMPWEWPTAATGAISARSRPSAASRSRVASWVSSTPGRPSAAPTVSAALGPSSWVSQTCGSKGRGSAAASWPATGATRRADSSTSWVSREVSGSSACSSLRVANQSLP